MYVLAGELADGMHDKEAHLDTGEEFFARHGSAMLARQQASVRIQIL